MKREICDGFEISYIDEAMGGTAIWITITKLPLIIADVVGELERLDMMKYVEMKRIRAIKGFVKAVDEPQKCKLNDLPKGVNPPRKRIRKIGPDRKEIFFDGDIWIPDEITEIKCNIYARGNIWMPMSSVKNGATIIAGGGIVVGSIEDSTITCNSLSVLNNIRKSNVAATQNVFVEKNIMHSEILSGEHVTVEGKVLDSGHLDGGRICDSIVVGITVSAKIIEQHLGHESIVIAGAMPAIRRVLWANRGQLKKYLTKDWPLSSMQPID